MVKKPNSNEARLKRHARVRNKISGTADRPRLNVFRDLVQGGIVYIVADADAEGLRLRRRSGCSVCRLRGLCIGRGARYGLPSAASRCHQQQGEGQDEDCKVFQVQVFHGDFLHFWHFAMVFSGGGWRSRCQRLNLEYKKTAPYPTMGQELYSCDTTQIDAFASARSCAPSYASRWITGGHPSVPTCIHTNAFRPPSNVHSPYAVPLHSHHRQLSEGPVLQGYSSFSKVSLVFSCWRHYSRTSRTSQLSI